MTEHNELEELFKRIIDTKDDNTIEITPTQKLKQEIKALEKLSVIISTIGMGDLVKLYTNKKMKRGK